MKFVEGKGLEIGALDFPLLVSDGVQVQYVDRVSREQSLKNFLHLDSSKVVTPTYIDDGFSLSSIPKDSQDFVIANHVLEHSPNPIGTLEIWSRVIRFQGVLFISVPIAEKCFDKGRPITTIQHLLSDYTLCKEGQIEEFGSKNRVHYLEWITVSEPNLLKERGEKFEASSNSEIPARIDHFMATSGEIHFHTFTLDSFSDFLSFYSLEINRAIRVEKVFDNTSEVVAILRKV